MAMVKALMASNTKDLNIENLQKTLRWLEEKERHHAKRYEARLKGIEQNPEEEKPKVKAKKHEEKALRLIGAEMQIILAMAIFEALLLKKHLMQPRTIFNVISALVELFFDPINTNDLTREIYPNPVPAILGSVDN